MQLTSKVRSRKGAALDNYIQDKSDKSFLGSGTYGEVYMVHERSTGIKCAMKVVKISDMDAGVPSTTVREVSIMKELRHENLIQLRQVICTVREIYIVMELADCDLRNYMKRHAQRHPHRTPYLDKDLVRCFTQQLLSGIEHCHRRRVIHRDLKPQNLLIIDRQNQLPVLKIADFGLARPVSMTVAKLTQEVVTVWYRPPEILLGLDKYSSRVDMWSVGCIVAEMACGVVLFMGDCEIHTLYKIFMKLGTPNLTVKDEWVSVSELPHWSNKFPKWPKKKWQDIRDLGKFIGTAGCELLDKLMQYDPARRLAAKHALRYPYILEGPQQQRSVR